VARKINGLKNVCAAIRHEEIARVMGEKIAEITLEKRKEDGERG
jgi:hypothetical protein